MAAPRLFPLVALPCCLALISGCPRQTGSTERLPNREAIAKLLPAGLKLEDRIPDGRPTSATVEQYLVTYGARINEQGVLVDGKGRRIVFAIHTTPGTHRDHPYEKGPVPSGLELPSDPNTVRIVYKIEQGK